MNKLTIPEIREQLWALATESRELAERQAQIAARVYALSNELFRRPSVKKAGPRSARITPVLRARVREFVANNPNMANRDIGRVFNIDGGRVSEILAGKRGE